MVFFENCHNAIRTIPALIYDENKAEDVDSDGEDHAGDSVRYFLMTLHEGISQKPKTEIERKFEEMKRMEEKKAVDFSVYLP